MLCASNPKPCFLGSWTLEWAPWLAPSLSSLDFPWRVLFLTAARVQLWVCSSPSLSEGTTVIQYNAHCPSRCWYWRASDVRFLSVILRFTLYFSICFKIPISCPPPEKKNPALFLYGIDSLKRLSISLIDLKMADLNKRYFHSKAPYFSRALSSWNWKSFWLFLSGF